MVHRNAAILLAFLLLGSTAVLILKAADPADGKSKKPVETTSPADASPPAADNEPPRKNPADPTVTLRRLPPYDVWIDAKNKQVVVDGQVCLTRGPLEMFAVTKNTKEHEAVVSVNAKAFAVHAALLAVGAKPGGTVKFQPKYTPASGTKIEIFAYFTDEKGNQKKVRAQEWIRDVKTKKAMEYPWVFAGSGFIKDDQTDKEYYLAEAGDFICVSNFPDAMLDLPIESTSANEDLMFEAFTENIPPRGTKVTLVLVPEADKKPAGAKTGKSESK
jgi:hypothetical protein